MTFEIRRGTNISHWLSQSEARGEPRRIRFTKEDVRRLAGLGFDHLRLPIDEVQMWDAHTRREPESWDLMNACLDWSQECGLRVIVDLHILRSHYFNQEQEPALFTDPGEAKRFVALWEDLSEGLQSRQVHQVAYELMNEPVARDAGDWNRVYRKVYERLREREPRRLIVIGSNRWNSASTFDALCIPKGDPHLLLTFHYYGPMLITHYKAPWNESGRLYSGPIQYPGKPIPEEGWAPLSDDVRQKLAPANAHHDAHVMEQDLEQPLSVAKRTGLKLYCGEFGVLHTVPDPIRAAWYKDFLSVLDRHAIAWANWDYKGGFGLFGSDGTPTVVLASLLKP